MNKKKFPLFGFILSLAMLAVFPLAVRAQNINLAVADLKGNYNITFNLKGGGSYPQSITIDKMDLVTGKFTGKGYYVGNESVTFGLAGIVKGDMVEFLIIYDNSNFFINAKGTIAPDGSMSGTAASSGQEFKWTADKAMLTSSVWR